MNEDEIYYILDARSVVGNCTSWWCPDGQGYTCDLNKAGLYTLAYASSLRDTDVPVHRDIARRVAVTHVRIDNLRQVGALEDFDNRQAEAAERRRAEIEAQQPRSVIADGETVEDALGEAIMRMAALLGIDESEIYEDVDADIGGERFHWTDITVASDDKQVVLLREL